MTLIALLVAGSFAAQSAEPGGIAWETVTSIEPKFSAEMPIKSLFKEGKVPGPGGSFEQTHRMVKSGGATYQIITSEFPASQKQDGLSIARQQYLQTIKGSVIKEDRIALGKVPGLEILTESPAIKGEGIFSARTRIFVADRSWILMWVMSGRDRPLPEEAGRFLDSLKLGGAEDLKPELVAVLVPTTPEQTLRAFHLATVTRDEAALRSVTLPVDGLEILLQGIPIPPEQLDSVRRQIVEQPIRAMKAGERMVLPRGRETVVQPPEVSEDRAVLLPEGAPVPTRLRKVEGRWLVDPTPIINARRAADAARKKAQTKDR